MWNTQKMAYMLSKFMNSIDTLRQFCSRVVLVLFVSVRTPKQYWHPVSVLFGSTHTVSTLTNSAETSIFVQIGCTYFFYTFSIISVPLMLAFIQACFCWGGQRLLYNAETAARYFYEVQEMCALPPATSTAISEFKPRACELQVRYL